jgi:cell division protein FtsB
MRLNIAIIMLVVAFFFLQFRLWFETDGIRDMLHLKRLLVVQAIENEKLKKHNEALLFQIQRLQNSQDAVESRARNELGMLKKGETFYQIVK